MYSALEFARAAGFLIRRVPAGGVVLRGGILELGPDATDAAIIAEAARFIVIPAFDWPLRRRARMTATCAAL